MIDEDAPPALEVPTPDPVPGENPPAPDPAAPPAAALVVDSVKSEREIQLERDLETERDRAKRAEILAAEWQKENQELKTPPRPAPAPPKPKRKHNWLSPVIGAEAEE